METPTTNIFIKKGKKENFTFTSDKNNSFNVEFRNEYNALTVCGEFKTEIQTKKYEKSFTLTDLIDDKYNGYLSLFKSTEDIYKEITYIIKKKKEEVKITEETNQIIIHIPLWGFKYNEIILCLYEKKDEKEQLIFLHLS